MQPPDTRRPVRAVVLSGGGARGAYEAGVLKYLIEELPRRAEKPIQFDLICGTSVGAIHACYLAATAHEEADRAERLAEIWRQFQIEDVLPFSARDMIRIPRTLLGMRQETAELRAGRLPARLPGVLNTGPLERIVFEAIPWRWIRRNLREGRTAGVCVAATEIASGKTIVFAERNVGDPMPWQREVNLEARAARLMPVHALASAAIPILFPAVRVGRSYFADGGLRLNTPLLPALRLGADRVLVIGLRQSRQQREENRLSEARYEAYGNPVYMFGKVLNALLLDHLETDMTRLHAMNELLRDGQKAFGPDFVDRLNAVSTTREQPLRIVHDLVIRPSRDLGKMAAEILASKEQSIRLPPLLRFFLRATESTSKTLEADLLSYVLFDGDFAGPLVELGYEDARAREEELISFFSDAPIDGQEVTARAG